MSEQKRVYRFGTDAQGNDVTEGGASMKFALGGKGANLAEMCRIGLPVPGGFTITCQTCVEYSGAGNVWPEGTLDEIDAATRDLEHRQGKSLGDPHDPLLVSVRSGAPFSMPGMMDTVLNLGLNDDSVQGLIEQTKNPHFAWDSYRRFIQMFSNVVLGIDSDYFENALTEKRMVAGVKSDSELTAEQLKELVCEFREIAAEHISADEHPELVIEGKAVFPTDPELQLKLAIEAVFGSWMNERACIYRKANGISDDLGTAVNVQVMVYGNKGETSATGVAFTRNPADGTREFYGDFLIDAQGEDVVAGIRNTEPISDLKIKPVFAQAGEQLESIFGILENHYRDMCDIEFTIEQGKLYMLQTRVGKRTASAALKIAIDMVGEGLISREEAVSRIDPAQLDQLLHPQFDTGSDIEVLARGLNASPGAAVGAIVFSSEDAVAAADEGRPVILVRWETNPDDLKGMVAAEGILTSHGGKTSHAAVIARGMGAPCVCGVESFSIDAANKEVRVDGADIVLHEGDIISIDGTSGIVVLGAVDLVSPELTGDLETILGWADTIRMDSSKGTPNRVRVNADNPADAKLALEFGAEAIGLCRTEHMFLGDRKNIIQSFILTDDEQVKAKALEDLLRVQTDDFLQMFRTMDGRDVVVRLIDPPLHEFLDDPRELEVAIAKREVEGAPADELEALRKRLRDIDGMVESNPMLGLRGVRLSIVYPDLPLMQVRAIATAAARLKRDEGLNPHPEVLVPLVAIAQEHVQTRAVIERVVAEVAEEFGIRLDIPVGTMFELPRACMVADAIAEHSDFFSFGTNDLTQTTFGFSRDDAEAKFIPIYLHKKILESNPFETIDDVVVELVKMAVDKSRATKDGLMCGVCGEHGGDPASIMKLFNVAGVDYVSCSPYRVPVARLAAAQAKLEAEQGFSTQDK
ncbi:pyruvate phosphate dikinase [Coriobacterium glomerans PW2]|uniref:Pyruvate, phosphate dikinase n=1 Tax=Coriobacterium glomerans (strain ATCC 49209 / DSM 20642 / JCM 10262 / PW2) TaxID=700015 RepID=F2N9G0_CORGP|nr:pyruvate, phosphate dikinase [Coriobacterium glomerans]AEB06989.1 pyruvate phosphate dikinase [Coriobacterium glomerans PW2]